MVGIKTAFKFQFCAACTRFRRVRSIPTKLEVLSRMSFDAIVQVAYCNTVYSLRIRRTLVRPPSPSSWSWMDVCSSQSNVPDWPCVSNRETPSAAFSWGCSYQRAEANGGSLHLIDYFSMIVLGVMPVLWFQANHRWRAKYSAICSQTAANGCTEHPRRLAP